MDDWEGRLLVATPALSEGFFFRSVVQLVQHTEADGALGIVLNRPTDTRLSDVLPGWALLSPDPLVVFDGGPVEQDAVICLGRLTSGAPPEDSFVVVPGANWLATVDLDLDAGDALEEVRIFSGYAGWVPGQLEQEVDEGAWWVLDALPGDPFVTAPERLWRQVLLRQGMPLALVASYPADPSLN